MSRSTPRTWVYNELVTAAIMNAHVRDQLNAYWPYTTAGDQAYASAADTVARLAIGTAGQVETTNAGATAPEWAGGLKLIEEISLGAATASFDFTSIPQYYTHLKIMLQARGDRAATSDNLYLRFNNDSGNNYDTESNQAGLGTTENFGGSYINCGSIVAGTGTADIANQGVVWINNYSGTTYHKTSSYVGQLKYQNLAPIYTYVNSGFWRSTAAITRVTIYTVNGDLDAGSVASLYGLG